MQVISNGGAVVSAVASGATDIGESNIVSLAAAHGRDALIAIAPKLVIGAWFSTRSWAKAHPDLVRRFQRAMSVSGAWANANPVPSALLIEKYTGSKVEPGTQRVIYAEKLEPAMIQPLIDASAKYGSLKATFPAADFIAPEAVV